MSHDLLLTFGLRSSSLGPAGVAAAAMVEVSAVGALLALTASLALCFSRRLSSLSNQKNPIDQSFQG